ncbi:hypothetical protein GP2_004_00200 [Gordonia paraffinivorans NBRC 108238]|uniref:Uncharacterized protein n=1 Tax=Gordonia paraffinivorans NBRC 108238 TaxID=1223543 RepID=A0ABQ0IGK3_9ACTN|nr:hypothetical protein GP2_004_00200 [Gordonia paraffinivorans NBRC 108238]
MVTRCASGSELAAFSFATLGVGCAATRSNFANVLRSDGVSSYGAADAVAANIPPVSTVEATATQLDRRTSARLLPKKLFIQPPGITGR